MQGLTAFLVLAFLAVSVYSQTCPRCTPHCFNGDGSAKVCGSNGCGGSCGTCPAGQDCCRGTCTCAPNCVGRQCGDDGCGGNSCGSCADGQTCSNGVCVGTGTRTCGTRTCGHDRVGGSCGSCPAGQRCRGGQCECYYNCNDRNCGQAPQEAGSICPAQSCGTCPSGFECSTSGLCSQSSPCEIQVEVLDFVTKSTVAVSCSVAITGVGFTYSHTLNYSPKYTIWDIQNGSFGSYSFSTTCPGYLVSVESHAVQTTTTLVQLTVTPSPIPVEIYERGASSQLSVTCSVDVIGPAFYFGTFQWTRNTGVTFSAHKDYGYDVYTFTTTCPGYSVSEQDIMIYVGLGVIRLEVSAENLLIEVRNRYGSQELITVTASIEISFGGSFVETYSYRPGQVNNWAASRGQGTYSFVTTASGYDPSRETRDVVAGVSIITLYVSGCGDGVCADGEIWSRCNLDCAAVYFNFEEYSKNSPVNGYTVNFFSSNPRTLGGTFGPVRNSVQIDTTKSALATSNVIQQETFQHDQVIFVEVIASGRITFYWTVDLSRINPVGNPGDFFYLRGHLPSTFQATDLPYRIVNTWRTDDDAPAPYAPKDLNLHLFFPNGACDYSNTPLNEAGTSTAKCISIADSKQSGGPASMDFNLASGEVITAWNTKPPRDPILATTQQGRYLKDSDSYVVLYGVTGDAATGKQLGEVTLYETLISTSPTSSHDLWRIADISVTQPRLGGATIVQQKKLSTATINENLEMRFNCELNTQSFCVNFVVPYGDSGRK